MCTRKCPIGFRDYKGDFMKGVRTSQLCTRFNRDFIRNFKLIQYEKRSSLIVYFQVYRNFRFQQSTKN